jgi:uncharacterized NAD(P)/FAD-binding protein YdhS
VSYRTIAIVGAGFSGSLLAAQIVRRSPAARVLLIERSGVFGRGLAYGTTCPAHLLNVRSGRMSAFPDQPDHFVAWLGANRPEFSDPQGFAPRMIYGDYVQSILADAGPRIERVAAEVVKLEVAGDGVRLTLGDGAAIEADAAVLAIGNPPPDDANAKGLGESERYFADPRARGQLERVGERGDVLLLGAGLTMIDVVLALNEQGWKGRALAMSRRGLLPRPHDQHQAHAIARQPEAGDLLGMMREVRARMREVGWAEAMDEIRPFNQRAWRNATEQERGRFLRHLRPWWDVHRHRTARDVGLQISALVDKGRLRVAAGRIEVVEPVAEGLAVEWRPRGEPMTRTETFGWMVNCTGPLADLARSKDRLLTALFEDGVARVDGASLGLDVEPDCRVQDKDGRAHRRLFAIGPPTKSAFWEVVAVPEIRGQAQEIAKELVG